MVVAGAATVAGPALPPPTSLLAAAAITATVF